MSVIVLIYTSKIDSGRDVFILLAIYVVLMTIAYVPGILSIYTRVKWRNYKYAEHVRENIEYIGSSVFIVDDGSTNQINNRVVKMSYDVITDSIYYITNTLTAFLNSAISIGVFSFALDPSYAVLVFISFILIAIYIKYIQEKLRAFSKEEKNGLVRYFDSLDKGLVNIMHGSADNYKKWNYIKNEAEETFCKLSLRHEGYRQSSYLITSLMSLIPVSIFIAYVAFNNFDNPLVISVLLVSVTRIYHVISSMAEMVYNILSWGSLKGSISAMFVSIDEYSNDDRIIDYSKIETVPKRAKDDIINQSIDNYKRITVKGENGSGKTSLLALIKKKYGVKAIYYNPRISLAWKGCDSGENMSQGQKTMLDISNLSKSTADYILLDEWDAFLDASNIQIADRIIDDLSERKNIIEVRHRR